MATDQPVENHMAPIAVCKCGAPLIYTFVFPKYEWYCLDCGTKYGMFDAIIVHNPDEELCERERTYLEEWDENVSGRLIVPRSWLTNCLKCKMGDEHAMHYQHATEEEQQADIKAREWLDSRLVK